MTMDPMGRASWEWARRIVEFAESPDETGTASEIGAGLRGLVWEAAHAGVDTRCLLDGVQVLSSSAHRARLVIFALGVVVGEARFKAFGDAFSDMDATVSSVSEDFLGGERGA